MEAFLFLEQQTRSHGRVLSRTLLAQGFTFEGRRVPLIVILEAEKACDRLVVRCREEAGVEVTITGMDASLALKCLVELAPRSPYMAIESQAP